MISNFGDTAGAEFDHIPDAHKGKYLYLSKKWRTPTIVSVRPSNEYMDTIYWSNNMPREIKDVQAMCCYVDFRYEQNIIQEA